jgi:UDP-N-acetylmuramate dehydrogenase
MQPKEPSAGSCFKNPVGDYAGRLIEAVGLRGFRRGGAGFSQKHANFLVNLGGATFDEAIWLIDEAKRRVLESFGIALETEIKIV